MARVADVKLTLSDATLDGNLVVPGRARGLVLFAHASGSNRRSPRNRDVAAVLHARGFGTLLFDLLSREEAAVDARTGHLRFDIAHLARRLVAATDWTASDPRTRGLSIGYFGASTGAAAALVAAAVRGDRVNAVVSRGGRPDLARGFLERVTAPTLLIVGAEDGLVIELTREALARLRVESRLELVPGAGHLFEEPGAVETAARLAEGWFDRYLVARFQAAG